MVNQRIQIDCGLDKIGMSSRHLRTRSRVNNRGASHEREPLSEIGMEISKDIPPGILSRWQKIIIHDGPVCNQNPIRKYINTSLTEP